MSSSRWVLTDPATLETWTMPINPNVMTSPHPRKQVTTAYGLRPLLARPRSFLLPPTATSWEWEGVIRTKEHYDAYEEWAQKSGVVHVTDHLGRTWEVLIESFAPEDRAPTPQTPWRLRYTVRSLVLRRVS